MATVTLATLRTKARTRADMTNSPFVSDTELTEIVNSSWSELYDILVGAFEDYAVSSTTLSLVAGTDTYALPSDFYKLRGCDLVVGAGAGDYATLSRFEWSERDRYSNQWSAAYTANGHALRYCIQGSNLVFAPVPTAAHSVRLWYVPERTALAVDADTLTVTPGWEEYIALDAAIQMLLKEESDVSAHMARKEALRQRIVGMAPKRDADAPATMIRRRRRLYDDPGFTVE